MEQTMVFDSQEAVKQAYNTGNKEQDLATINALISGQVQIKSPDVQSSISEPITTNNDQPTMVVENIPNEVVPIDVLEEQRRYNAFLEDKQKTEHYKYLADLKAREDEIVKERTAREQAEERIRQLSETQNVRPLNNSTEAPTDEEDEAYISEYAKRTRAMVEEIRSQTGNFPAVQELADKVSTIEKDYNRRRQDAERVQQEKETKDREQKIFDSIRQFQTKVPELQTTEDIKEIDQKYLKFRKDIGHLVNAKSVIDIEKAIKNYYEGGEVKQKAIENGIRELPDYNKYSKIAELMDLKNGVRYDPIIGKEIPVLDDEGNRVRYRSLDEVYRLNSFDEQLVNARKQTMKEISNKLTSINNAPVTLTNDYSDAFTSGFTVEQEREVLNMDPKEWSNPEKRKMAEIVYAKRGLELPQYRGRKF